MTRFREFVRFKKFAGKILPESAIKIVVFVKNYSESIQEEH
jgi:hypothetical protein